MVESATKYSVWGIGARAMLAALVAMAMAFAVLAAGPVVNCGSAQSAAWAASVHDFSKPSYDAFYTQGKGSTYDTYTSSMFNYAPVVYKAKIKGSKLYVWGQMENSKGKKITFKKKAFTLSKKAKYYQHTGNGSFYNTFTKAKMKKLFETKAKNQGGDISFKIKNGKIVRLVAQ